jgi:hypothetical protein
MTNKFNARKVPLDGYVFDSQLEATRYGQLKQMVMAGEISHLSIHPKYVVLDDFSYRGKHTSGITYVADFEYLEKGIFVVEDVKGVETAVFKIKEKLFKNKFHNYDFRILTKDDI